MSRSRVAVTVDLVVFTIREQLEVLLQRETRERCVLPGAFVQARESLEEAARSALQAATGRDHVYHEQLYTFGDPGRDPRGHVISVAYFAVLPSARVSPEASFHPARRPPPLAYDHSAILASAVERLQTKAEYSTVPLRFLVEPFTLSEVQEVYEVILDRTLDKRNFRRKVLALEAIEEVKGRRRGGAHRPARLFRLSAARPYLLKERGILFPF